MNESLTIKCYYATRKDLQDRRICTASWECIYSEWKNRMKYCQMTEKDAREILEVKR